MIVTFVNRRYSTGKQVNVSNDKASVDFFQNEKIFVQLDELEESDIITQALIQGFNNNPTQA